MNKIIAVSGYFLWFHVGYIELFKEAKKFGKLVIILNNDSQQLQKYNSIVVPLEERRKVLLSIRDVDDVVESIDKDRTVCKTLELLKPDYFGNGGDQTNKTIPETEICERLGIKLVFGLGDKIQSSSKLLKLWKNI